MSEEWARDGGEEDAIVVGRGGWLRLPEELLHRAGIQSRAVARLEDDAIVVTSPEPILPSGVVGLSGSEPQSLRGEGRVVAEVRGLGRRFAATTAIDRLDATFTSGGLTAVTGPSGSGKTTLLHLLAGLDLPTAGEVVVLGTRVDALDRDARAALRAREIGFVGQQPGLVPFLSARENVELALALRDLPTDDDRAGEVLAAVGLVRARRPASVPPLDGRAGARRDRARARAESRTSARGRTDVAAGSGERRRRRGAARAARAGARHRGRLRNARSGRHRPGRRASRAERAATRCRPDRRRRLRPRADARATRRASRAPRELKRSQKSSRMLSRCISDACANRRRSFVRQLRVDDARVRLAGLLAHEAGLLEPVQAGA